MSGFLDDMARHSRERVAAARALESDAALERRAADAEPAPPLALSPLGFDVIAEIKLRSPAVGVLGAEAGDWLDRAAAYGAAGAAAVSVLTEPSRFDGSLEHLQSVARRLRPQGVPAMRKDFLVDPYQVLEARASGAGGVLVILRMLSAAQCGELVDAAARHGLFVLLEAFDADELALAGEIAAAHSGGGVLLAGLNCRDLQSLQVVPERFAELAPALPRHVPVVAESGIGAPADAARLRRLGYRLALVGSALMSHEDPGAWIGALLRAARSMPGVKRLD
ncbi:MAG: indole-3-glycerol-phosphate synthase [Gammaproteobacteria bacterium]|nr:indole-3-glycerol-phosphate synthase [Gammaproteobacteria bacterium]